MFSVEFGVNSPLLHATTPQKLNQTKWGISLLASISPLAYTNTILPYCTPMTQITYTPQP